MRHEGCSRFTTPSPSWGEQQRGVVAGQAGGGEQALCSARKQTAHHAPDAVEPHLNSCHAVPRRAPPLGPTSCAWAACRRQRAGPRRRRQRTRRRCATRCPSRRSRRWWCCPPSHSRMLHAKAAAQAARRLLLVDGRARRRRSTAWRRGSGCRMCRPTRPASLLPRRRTCSCRRYRASARSSTCPRRKALLVAAPRGRACLGGTAAQPSFPPLTGPAEAAGQRRCELFRNSSCGKWGSLGAGRSLRSPVPMTCCVESACCND